ncbi:MAG: twin-arginine translocation signal domain-containing protein [Lachnospiraceae bacterium]|nr:twin-arginine translocation signal domain-containing protein [Lachnospiraceae bacterium]
MRTISRRDFLRGSAAVAASSIAASMFVVPALAEEETEPENTVTGDASADGAFVVWGWNDDIKTILDTVFAEAYPDEYSRIVFVNTGGSDYYQTKLDAVLEDPSNELYPDLMGLEVDYVQKYTNSDWLLNVADIGITDEDMANMYQYNVDLGSDYDGNVKALFWQATPGCYAVRADLAATYLGTTDPDEIAAKFADLDTILETAREVNEASGGTCKLFSGYDEIKRSLMNSREVGFYDENDVITLDENITTYLETAKTLYDEELTYNTSQWSADWYANMDGDGTESNAALAYFGCPWFVYWSLSSTWKGQTILVPAQEQCFWGGTGLAATTGCSDTELAALIMQYLACNTEGMVAINAQNSDYVNNTEAIAQIIESGASADGNGYMYTDAGQNFIEFFYDKADAIDASTVTAEDQTILSLLDTECQAYATGEKDLETALADLTASIHDTYSYLSVE